MANFNNAGYLIFFGLKLLKIALTPKRFEMTLCIKNSYFESNDLMVKLCFICLLLERGGACFNRVCMYLVID